jgi:hypothetical protein
MEQLNEAPGRSEYASKNSDGQVDHDELQEKT